MTYSLFVVHSICNYEQVILKNKLSYYCKYIFFRNKCVKCYFVMDSQNSSIFMTFLFNTIYNHVILKRFIRRQFSVINIVCILSLFSFNQKEVITAYSLNIYVRSFFFDQLRFCLVRE